ncbi:IclR family transcriptional regulator [Bosea sp. (in: a-proteobacteria)]|uniref:IclR family transcriptional regulator n=1 Tax=Bosea sp. (in: a-proteobacteria) TaxID=1871050 RepID=UPI002FC6F235
MSTADTKQDRAARLPPGVPIVRALDRAIALLRAFRPEQPRLGLSELSRQVGLDKGTARRLLQTLQLNDLVEHDERTQTYALAVGLIELGSAVTAGRELRDIAGPYLTEIAEKTGATSFLWVHISGRALCVDRVRASLPHVDATWFAVGAQAPLNCGGGPRVILAHLDEAQRRQALALELPKRAPASQTDPELLWREAERIRAQGWELAADDFFIGLTGVGVPIFDRAGVLAGALSISSLTSIVAPDGHPVHLEALCDAAKRIGARLLPA